MKKLFLLPLSLIFSIVGFSQVWQDDLNGYDGTLGFISSTANPYNGGVGPDATLGTNGRIIAGNLTVSGIGRGSATSDANAFGAYGATGFPNANSVNTNAYFQFTLTPASGYKLNLSNFVYTAGTGIDFITPVSSFAFRSSLDGFTSNIGSPDVDGTTISLSASQFQNITTPITFRLYAYNGGGGSNYWEIQDFRFNGAVALPVDFGSIEAVQKNDAVAVKWTTLKETNSSYFEIEASKDGKEFTTVKTVQSKNGNSDTPQDYEVTIAASDVASLLGVPVLLGLLSLGFTRRKRLLAGAVALMILGVNFIGCSKQGDTVDVNTIDKVFIRIKQVDKDGAFKYSDVIQVIRK